MSTKKISGSLIGSGFGFINMNKGDMFCFKGKMYTVLDNYGHSEGKSLMTVECDGEIELFNYNRKKIESCTLVIRNRKELNRMDRYTKTNDGYGGSELWVGEAIENTVLLRPSEASETVGFMESGDSFKYDGKECVIDEVTEDILHHNNLISVTVDGVEKKTMFYRDIFSDKCTERTKHFPKNIGTYVFKRFEGTSSWTCEIIKDKATVESMKAEAIRRMEAFGVHRSTIEQFEKDNEVVCSLDIEESPLDDRQKELLKEFEEKYGTICYYVIRTDTTFGVIDSFLYVSDCEEEWEDETEYAYCYNYGYEESEVGLIKVEKNEKFGHLFRVA